MTENAADPASIDRKRSKSEEKEVTRKLVIRTLMGDARGRAYLWDELTEMNVFSQSLQFGRDGYAATAFSEGRRSLGLRLLTDITRWCPHEYMLMTQENSKVEIPDAPVAE